jgi:cytochrome c oxidase assembly protein subunit 16
MAFEIAEVDLVQPKDCMSLPRHRLTPVKGLQGAVHRQPFLYFGLPFLLTMVLGSFALSSITRSRYDYNDSKVAQVSQEESMKMSKARRKVDLREEYYRLSSAPEGEWENKRIERLPGQAEWGELPPEARK